MDEVLDERLPVARAALFPFTTMRFDTAFFVANLPPEQEATIWPGTLPSQSGSTRPVPPLSSSSLHTANAECASARHPRQH
jgi:hypothetical protein